jgi:hypothetical protein
MDVWAWVNDRIDELNDNGHERLAAIMEEVPTAATDNRHDAVEALVPEGIALANSINDAWIGVYLRHWLLQSRILHRHDVSTGMQIAIDALDLAHDDKTRDCPQSVCTVQDVCSAWGIVDGPGHVEERLEVSAETLARIDPSWPCFGCISAEQASALMDGERWGELQSFCEKQIAQIDDASDAFKLNHALARALLRQGKVEQARAIVDGTATFATQGSRKTDQQLMEALVLCAESKHAEAHELLPPLGQIEPADVQRWAHVALELARANALTINTAELGRTLREHTLQLQRFDARFETALLFVRGAELALHRGQTTVARLNLDDAAGAARKVKRPERVTSECARVLALVDAAEAAAGAVVAYDVGGGSDAELEAVLPDDPESAIAGLTHTLSSLMAANAVAAPAVAGMLSGALSASGFESRAEAVLTDARAHFPSDEALLMRQARLWRRAGNEAALKGLLATPSTQRVGLLELSLLAEQRQRHGDGAAQLQLWLAEHPADLDVAEVAARLWQRAGDAVRALEVVARALVAVGDVDVATNHKGLLWEQQIAATIAGDHGVARAAASALGFRFGGEGPIDEPFAWCRVQMVDDLGRSDDYAGLRISPCTARLTARIDPLQPPVFGSIVCFQPTPLAVEEGPPLDDGTPSKIFTYPAITVITPSRARVFTLDGYHPGEALLEAFFEAVSPLAAITLHSGDRYRLPLMDGVIDDDGERSAPGLYLSVIVANADVPLQPLLEAVQTATATWPRPTTYRSLLQATVGGELLAEHERIAEALGLD